VFGWIEQYEEEVAPQSVPVGVRVVNRFGERTKNLARRREDAEENAEKTARRTIQSTTGWQNPADQIVDEVRPKSQTVKHPRRSTFGASRGNLEVSRLRDAMKV
jgi:hypothetical protein